ncbi:hypothetical protein A2U01_0083404, partial [Trifolium medium]|nr:hypothetical protein [Trifolium medium]
MVEGGVVRLRLNLPVSFAFGACKGR